MDVKTGLPRIPQLPLKSSATSNVRRDPISQAPRVQTQAAPDAPQSPTAPLDPMQANVALLTNGLMSVSKEVEEVIENYFKGSPRSLDHLAKVLPAIDTFLRLSRQVDRFAHFQLRTNNTCKKVAER